MRLRGHGVEADLPAGWEGTIELERGPDGPRLAELGAVFRPVAHLATFPLPAERGDFGSGAVELMGPDDIFVALVEYGADESDQPLFAARGLPRALDPRRFRAESLQRPRPGQGGWQAFFNERGRAFCLYVVLGDLADAHLLARKAERVLSGIRVEGRRE